MNQITQFPSQNKSFKQKGKKWRKECVDWGANKSYFNYSPVRNSVRNMKINQDLINGHLHMDDMELIINPTNLQVGYIPDNIQHYPIINSKLNLLQGEESKRVFDARVVVTNPNSISEIENNKRDALFARLEEMMRDNSQSEEEFNHELEKVDEFFTYEWQDIREVRANAVLSHYSSEQNFPYIFNRGFMDAMIYGEEIYQVDIVGGEPVLEKLNPMKVRVYRSGYSNHIEDADMIVIEDFWSPGKVIDYYYDALTPKDIKYIEELPNKLGGITDSDGNYDDRAGYVRADMVTDQFEDGFYSDLFAENGVTDTLMPYDTLGNIRVIRVYWKSRRKIKKVKSYDKSTGEITYTFYNEDYITKENEGEEEQVFWINEAWEGTKIGEDIYVNMRPRIVQYNRMSNPSRCHFGIFGSIYNKNDDRPYSLVDMMKPYSYLYDAVHYRLNQKLAKNWGKIITLDLAKVPKGWDIEKWMYYAQVNSTAVIDSFKEGSNGRMAGGMNNASSGVIDAELGTSIQYDITLLEFIKGEMGEVAGISKQREGQISNRETVGGVERSTLQSSHSTEWLFIQHDDLKRRVLEGFVETFKAAYRGRKKKFQYILSDGQQALMEIDGDLFAENDYGLAVDISNDAQKINQNLDSIAQAAIQNQRSLSVVMRLFTSKSIAEKIRIIEHDERKQQEQQQQQLKQEQELAQAKIQQSIDEAKAKMEQEYKMHQEDNETKILVAEINSKAEADRLALMNQDDGIQPMSEEARATIKEKARQFDAQLKLDREKLAFEKDKAAKDRQVKRTTGKK